MTELRTQSFGKYLRNERLLREITLEEIAEATKIKGDYLNALETDQFDKIPNQTFLKGYIRAYSRYCGLNEDEVLINFEFYDQLLNQNSQKTERSVEKGNKTENDRKNITGKRWLVYGLLFLCALLLSYFFAYFSRTLPFIEH